MWTYLKKKKSIYLFCQMPVGVHKHHRTDGCAQHNRPAADQHVLEVLSIIPTADLLTAAVCLQPTSLAMSKHLFGDVRCRLGNENRRNCWRVCQNNGDFVQIIMNTNPSCHSPTSAGNLSAGHVSIHCVLSPQLAVGRQNKNNQCSILKLVSLPLK